MARDWRRAVLAAFAAVMLGSACALGALAQQEEEQDETETKSESKAKKKQDPAEAQRTIDAALKQVLAGKVDQAVQTVSATMAGGNLPPAIMAKALYVRGLAYRKQGRTAQAISDLTGALWLKGGLGGEEREDAEKEKAAAYADAGLADPGNSRPAPKSAGGGGGNWLSGIFGGFGSEASSPPPKAPPKVSSGPVEPPPTPPPKASDATTLSSSWAGHTDVQVAEPKAPQPKASKTAKTAPHPAPSGKKAEGPYLVQLAAMRTEAEARALAAKAKREHGALLASRGQSIERQVYGNMGAYYRVRFGPFASAQETQTVCAKLQGSGIDCLPLAQ